MAARPWAAAGLKKNDSLEVKVRALLAERRQRMGYERELIAAAEIHANKRGDNLSRRTLGAQQRALPGRL